MCKAEIKLVMTLPGGYAMLRTIVSVVRENCVPWLMDMLILQHQRYPRALTSISGVSPEILCFSES